MGQQYADMRCHVCNGKSRIPAGTRDGRHYGCGHCPATVGPLIRCVKCGHYTSLATHKITMFNHVPCVHCGNIMNFMGKDGHLLGTDENLFISEEIVDPTAQVPAPPVVQLQTREPQSVVPPPAPRQVQSSVWNIPIMQPLPPDPSSAMWETVTAVQNSKPKAPQAPRPINWPLAAARIGIFIALPLLIIGALILLLIKLL